ncbi:hypothetical protein O1L60_17375 [Streptomyces diastatochromogenes]|nr:hypothetical protein [Streptomyces diastatochromogenes]
MPKKGQRLPWRLSFVWVGNGIKAAHPHSDEEGARRAALDMFETARRRESELQITIENRDTGEKYEMTANDAIKDTVNANLERIRVMVANGGDESGIAEIVEETEGLLKEIKGKGSVALRNELRDALKVALQPQLPADDEPAGDEPQGDTEAEGDKGAEVATRDAEDGDDEDDDEDDEGDGEPLVIPADVAALITEASAHVSSAVNLGVEAQKIAEKVSVIQLTMRKKTLNKFGIPDLPAIQKYTRNHAGLVYVEVAEQISDDDVDKADILKSLKRAVRNKNSDTLVGYLRALDADKEAGLKEAETYYPEAAAAYLKAKEKETDESPASIAEAVYALYASKGIDLPRKGRTEVERERRAALRAAQGSGADDSRLTPEVRLENYLTTIAGSWTRRRRTRASSPVTRSARSATA